MRSQPLTGWRRIAYALWSAPNDPQIYGILELDARPCLRFIENARAQGHHVTPTHLVGRALAHALEAVPELNVRVAFGRSIPRRGVDIFFISTTLLDSDLAGAKIENMDRKSASQVARELDAAGIAIKTKGDSAFAMAKSVMNWLPGPLLHVALRGVASVVGTHATPIRALGLEASPFGSAMVSSVGMLGLPMGFAPLAWMYSVPLFVLVAEIVDKPVACEGRVEIRPILPITVTIDHRAADGSHIALALTAFRAYLADPAAFEPATTAAVSRASDSARAIDGAASRS